MEADLPVCGDGPLGVPRVHVGKVECTGPDPVVYTTRPTARNIRRLEAAMKPRMHIGRTGYRTGDFLGWCRHKIKWATELAFQINAATNLGQLIKTQWSRATKEIIFGDCLPNTWKIPSTVEPKGKE